MHGGDDLVPMADTNPLDCPAETVEVSFHGVAYVVNVSTVNGDTMCLEVEQKSDASRWRGDFTARYIEDITSKTGNFKKFAVFVKMLLSALKQASDSVFVDLLTYQDLEVLKARKAGGAAPAKTLVPNNKRYLILTYAAEFDRVHYPLPLLYEENPDPQRLKSIIQSLRAELDTVHAGAAGGRRAVHTAAVADSAEVRRLRDDNTALRQELRQLQKALTLADDGGGDRAAVELTREMKKARKECELLSSRVEALEAELERERGLHRRELRRKAKENQEVYDELSRSRDQIRDLKLQVRQLTEELEARPARSSMDRVRQVYSSTGVGRPYTEPAGGNRPYSAGSRKPSRGSSPSGRAGTYNAAPRPYEAPTGRPRDTSSRERSPSPGTSRPASAPASRSGARFDPTEYVKQRQEAMARRSHGSSRAPTPPRSAASSGRASPVVSRPASAERERPGAGRGLSPAGSRSSSIDGAGRRPAVDRFGRPVMDYPPAARSRDISPRVQHPDRGTSAWSRQPYAPTGQGGNHSRPQSAERATSPGRALQEVKKKLSEFVTKRSTDDLSSVRSGPHAPSTTSFGPAAPPTGPSSSAGGAGQSSRTQVFNEATAEIADIDSRLHALQNFLRMAKASSAASVSSSAVT